ncbi:MAG: acetyl-CoA carboxylase carboxyltransferase subunit alpha [Nitrospirae bacterium]|nr:MAG: acetyl-CoA carboxylase carboxyltransferase subunit alpha [Nitrospirota bacterium]
MREYLDFEKPIAELEDKLEKLAASSHARGGRQEDLNKLRARLHQLQAEIYAGLSAWQRTQVARHLQRPSTLDYIGRLCDSFIELHGDRAFADDHAIVGGLARFNGRPIVVIGHQKGKTLKERMYRNFGMPNPEGYRKALRLMRLAEKFGRPVLTFIDTPGAYPGIGAEERGQAEAIGRNLLVMASLQVPIVTVVIGEGGSGGALAIGVADRLLMLQHAVYSVISPEGCAAILWNDQSKATDAAEALNMTADDLQKLGITDQVIPEPLGGAHRDPMLSCDTVKKAIEAHLSELLELSTEDLLKRRYDKYRRIGVLAE